MIFGATDRPIAGNPASKAAVPCGAGGRDVMSLRYLHRLRQSLEHCRIGGEPLSAESIAQAVAEAQRGFAQPHHRLFPSPAPAPLRQQHLQSSPGWLSVARRVLP